MKKGRFILHFFKAQFHGVRQKEQDLVISTHFALHRRVPEFKDHYKIENKKGISKLDDVDNLSRHSMQYYFADIVICRDMYVFLHCLKKRRYENIKRHFEKNGLAVREHKSANKAATREIVTSYDIFNIVKFLKQYAKKVTVPLPGRMPQFGDYVKVLKLPSCDTKLSVYRKYVQAAERCDPKIRGQLSSMFG